MAKPINDKIADMFAKRFEEYNSKVLEQLAKTINEFNGLTYTQAFNLANQLKYDKSYIEMIDELSRLTGKSKKEIKKILEETVKQHIEFADTFFKAKNMATPIYENDIYLQNLVNTISNLSNGDFVNIARSTGFAFLDKAGHIQFLDMQETYYKVIDECVYAISEGKENFNQSMRKTIKQLSESGVRRIVYANEGKQVYTQRIDTAVRRNIKDSMRQIALDTEKEFGKRFGATGVEVTVHENPAPDHEYVQGHQFTLEEFDKFQTDQNCVDVNGIEYPATSEETGHDRRSIGEYNCYHDTLYIIVGVSKPLYTQEQLDNIIEKANQEIEIDGKKYTRYEATQLQRKIETEIRYAKDRHMMYKEVNDKEGMLDEQLRITQLTRKYKEISNKANIREQLNRASVSGYRRQKIDIKQYYKDKLIGIKYNENEIGVSQHFIERASERNLKINDFVDALKNPLSIGKYKQDTDGMFSVKVIGKNVTFVINPENGNVITWWKTSKKIGEKHGIKNVK